MPVFTLPATLPRVETTSPVIGSFPTTYIAFVGGAAVSIVAGTLAVTNQIGQRSQGSVTVWGPLGVVWQYGTQFLLYDETGTAVYSGYVTKDKAYRDAGARQSDAGYLLHDLTLVDNVYRADKRRVFKSYLNVTAGYIVSDLLGAYLAAEGVTRTATSIATGPLVVEVIWNGTKSVSEAISWLAQQAGYWWQIDTSGVLWFQPYGGTPAPLVVDGTTVDSMQDVYIESGNDMLVNRQFAKGAFAETGVLTETFHGNSLTRSFTLSYPVSTVKQVLLNGLDVTAISLKKGDTGGYFYYALGDAVLAQDPSQPLLTSGDTLVVTFRGRYPVLASAQNSALIAAQAARERIGSGLVESIYSDSKVRTLAAAFQIASAQLAHYATDITLLNFTTRTKGLAPGQMLTVNLPDFALANTQMLINSVSISDQQNGQTIFFTVQAVGGATASSTQTALEAAQWQTYWQNLMNQQSDPSDFTDVQDTSTALLSTSVATRSPSVAITHTKTTCPIIGASTFPGAGTIVC